MWLAAGAACPVTSTWSSRQRQAPRAPVSGSLTGRRRPDAVLILHLLLAVAALEDHQLLVIDLPGTGSVPGLDIVLG